MLRVKVYWELWEVFFLQGKEALRDVGRSLERSSLGCPRIGTGKCLAKGGVHERG